MIELFQQSPFCFRIEWGDHIVEAAASNCTYCIQRVLENVDRWKRKIDSRKTAAEDNSEALEEMIEILHNIDNLEHNIAAFFSRHVTATTSVSMIRMMRHILERLEELHPVLGGGHWIGDSCLLCKYEHAVCISFTIPLIS